MTYTNLFHFTSNFIATTVSQDCQQKDAESCLTVLPACGGVIRIPRDSLSQGGIIGIHEV